jgi:hypothetical protein
MLNKAAGQLAWKQRLNPLWFPAGVERIFTPMAPPGWCGE